MTEDEMVGWHYWLSGHEFEQTLGNSEGQGSWCAAVHGIKRVQHNLATEQKQTPNLGQENQSSSSATFSLNSS